MPQFGAKYPLRAPVGLTRHGPYRPQQRNLWRPAARGRGRSLAPPTICPGVPRVLPAPLIGAPAPPPVSSRLSRLPWRRSAGAHRPPIDVLGLEGQAKWSTPKRCQPRNAAAGEPDNSQTAGAVPPEKLVRRGNRTAPSLAGNGCRGPGATQGPRAVGRTRNRILSCKAHLAGVR